MIRDLFENGGSVREALAQLKASGKNSVEAVRALREVTPLSLNEAKVLCDDFCSGDSRYQDQLTLERLTLLALAEHHDYLARFFREAVIYGHRWLTLAPARSGFDFWWKRGREGVYQGSWSGADLPSLEGLHQSFVESQKAHPELGRRIEIVRHQKDELTLRIRLDGEA